MSMEIQRLSPLWETFPNHEVQPAEKGEKQYLLSTGQLVNPAEMCLGSANAELAMSLLVELRERAINVYSELTRISL